MAVESGQAAPGPITPRREQPASTAFSFLSLCLLSFLVIVLAPVRLTCCHAVDTPVRSSSSQTHGREQARRICPGRSGVGLATPSATFDFRHHAAGAHSHRTAHKHRRLHPCNDRACRCPATTGEPSTDDDQLAIELHINSTTQDIPPRNSYSSP